MGKLIRLDRSGHTTLAEWTEADILTFAEKLKIRADRITKDDWVGQARQLVETPPG